MEIVKVQDLILTRLEKNVESDQACQNVFLYNHGFPDASVTPDALMLFKQGVPTPDHCFFASRFPRKLCEHLLKKFDRSVFVAFNTRGIPGSSAQEFDAERASEAPPEFVSKTLTGDMQDIAAVVSFCCQRFSNSRLFICGLSTGAFLSLAYAASKELHPPGDPVAGCFTFACVDDIPGSVALDFSEDQVKEAKEKGFCYKEFFPFGCPDNPQRWKLSKDYIDSYSSFPGPQELARDLQVPLLILHGSEDRHVPPQHAERLFEVLRAHENNADLVELALVPKGNHFLSSTSALNKALKEVESFIKRRT